MSEAPFRVGQRVRLNAEGRQQLDWSIRWKTLCGIVTGLYPGYGSDSGRWYVRIHRDGLKRPDSGTYWSGFWEAIPPYDMTFDQTAQALADAVKRGETDAALLLADHLFELYGGTRKQA